MTRVVLTVLVPLLLPTAIYLLWAVVTARAKPAAAAAEWPGPPWLWLALTGIALSAGALFVLVAFGGRQTGTYVPPHAEDGRIVPGHDRL